LGVTSTQRGTVAVKRTIDPAAMAEGRVVDASQGRVVVSSGRFLTDTHVAIVDAATGTALGADRIGEVWVGGTGIAGGYWRQDEATAATFGATVPGHEGGYLRTGDVGFLDAEGRLTITGRSKDLIVVAGKNHFPSDLEQTAEAASPAVRPHFTAAFAVDEGEREGVVVLAEIKPAELEGLDVEAVGHAIMRRVNAEHEISVDTVVLLEAGQIPKTTSGKVQRAQCRRSWLDGALSAHGVVRRGGQA
jgi:acyl-CoA synthetase (AMP-forming)/AMP-acid ligase II